MGKTEVENHWSCWNRELRVCVLLSNRQRGSQTFEVVQHSVCYLKVCLSFFFFFIPPPHPTAPHPFLFFSSFCFVFDFILVYYVLERHITALFFFSFLLLLLLFFVAVLVGGIFVCLFVVVVLGGYIFTFKIKLLFRFVRNLHKIQLRT